MALQLINSPCLVPLLPIVSALTLSLRIMHYKFHAAGFLSTIKLVEKLKAPALLAKQDCREASFVVMLHDRHKFYTAAEKNIEHYGQLKVVRSKAHRVVRYAASKLAL